MLLFCKHLRFALWALCFLLWHFTSLLTCKKKELCFLLKINTVFS
ncbi:hypothetical protein HMPREF1981_01836 [Bacteroides pyogenes F0041]|uniref:Uncharacterized protein n=1 Tax=Bacteroides pyogenes F0041 TaxID=1321819 RepID=U2C493_9BACE|nr:hypothetical protein HMPREF1981_01836 [Bacteroides pyogenes F0041]